MDRPTLPRVVLGKEPSLSPETGAHGAVAVFILIFLLLVLAAVAARFYMTRRASRNGSRFQFCGQCGHRLFSGATFCEACGVRVAG